MNGVIQADSWHRLVGVAGKLKAGESSLSMADDELVLSARREPITISLRVPVECAESGSVKLPSGTLAKLGSPDLVQLSASGGQFAARAGERVIRSAVIAGAPAEPTNEISGEPVPVKAILHAFATAGAARVVEKGSHSRDAAPFQLLSISATRTVAGQPGGKSTAVGPGIPGLIGDPVHFPLGSVAMIRSLLAGISDVVVRSIGSRLIISGDGLTMEIGLQPGESTPLDGPSDSSFFDGVKAHGTKSSLSLPDGTALSKSFPGPLLSDGSSIRSIDGSFETTPPDGWPVGCFDAVNLVRCACAITDPTETVEIVSSPKFALLTGSRGVAMVLGRAEGLK